MEDGIVNGTSIAKRYKGFPSMSSRERLQEVNIIINRVNELISQKIVKNAYKFKTNAGTIRVARTKRRRASINMPETMKLKADILRRGGTLYKVLERDEDGNITKDNGGEKYLVFNTDLHYFHWSINGEHIVSKGDHIYRFFPTRGKKGNKELLGRELKGNKLAKLRYTK